MRVLQVIARLNVGGTARYVGRLATDLPARGIETIVATGQVQGAEQEDPIAERLVITRVPHLGRRIDPINDLRAHRELQKIVDEYKPQIIHTHTFKAGLIGRLIKSDAKRVHTYHGHLLDDPEFSGWKKPFVIQVERTLAHRADILITVGSQVAEDLIAIKIGERSQYRSISPGVDALFLPSREAARIGLELVDEPRPIVSWLARVTGVKAPHRLVELAKEFPNARFLIAGGGDLLEEVKRNAPSNLTVLGWRDASTIWAATDIALSTSDNEGMPVALIEAQLAGIPVVATSVGGVAEVVANEETGFVVPPNTRDLAEALTRLLDDPYLRITFGAAAKVRATRLFDPARMLDNHIALYQKLLLTDSPR